MATAESKTKKRKTRSRVPKIKEGIERGAHLSKAERMKILEEVIGSLKHLGDPKRIFPDYIPEPDEAEENHPDGGK